MAIVILGRFPAPEEVKPVRLGELVVDVQLKVEPTRLLVHVTAVVFVPEQMG